MALENTVAQYQIQITRTGEGAAVALQDFKNLDTASKNLAGSVGASSESLKSLRNVNLLARQSMSELNAMAMIMASSRFPELTQATIAARLGIMSLRTTAQLTGASLWTIAPIIGGVAAAAAAGVLMWKSYRDEMKATEEQAKAMADALEKMPALVTEITRLASTGMITPAQSQQWMQQLGRTNPSFPANYSVFGPAQSFSGPPTVKSFQTGKVDLSQIGMVTPNAIADVQKQMRDAGILDANNRLSPQIEALEKLKDLQQKMSIETLDGYEKERAQAQLNYRERVAQIQQLALIAGQKFPDDQKEALIAAAQAENENKRAAIVAKEDAEMVQRAQKAAEESHRMLLEQQREADEEERAMRQAKQAETLVMIKDFNQQERIYELTTSDDKRTILQKEFEDRHEFNSKLAWDYRITLDQMREMDNDAKIKYLEGLKSMEKQEELHTMTIHQMNLQAAQEFSGGFADAFVGFINGTKSAQQAFTDFALSFIAQIQRMIVQQLILNAIKSMFFGGGGMAASGAAFGGFFPIMAASGLAGVSSVSSPTYFPRFNVVAGEAGREMLTVLARPRMMDVGGMQAIVGQAGRNTLAITSAADLANKGGGSAVIEVRPAPGYEATIVSNAIAGAVLKVTSDMGQYTPLRQAVKQANA